MRRNSLYIGMEVQCRLFCSVCYFAQFVVLLSLLFCSSFGFHFSNKHLWTDVRQRVCVRRNSLHLGMEDQHRMIVQWEGNWLYRQLS